MIYKEIFVNFYLKRQETKNAGFAATYWLSDVGGAWKSRNSMAGNEICMFQSVACIL